MKILTVPGIDGSGPGHWQSLWEQQEGSDCTRFSPSSWSQPQAGDWLEAVDRAVQRLGSDVLIVAHSLGCLPVAHLAGQGLTCRGIVLVAPPDVHGPAFPPVAAGFADLAAAPSKVPALVVSSSDDPYCSPTVAAQLARRWSAKHVDLGPCGHLNESAGLGQWDLGWNLIQDFADKTAA
ncbi:RBBP9/YdeN family alpha/beta hydrolase [Kineococcus sp. SYSU DK002]|uniref:RBBP9/YdeN family alpha/beta hydrolase n=1 Tax=Kineococcus sp. SYSU DK002 TaxID=3383123 RepID=UPI003D7E4215